MHSGFPEWLADPSYWRRALCRDPRGMRVGGAPAS